MTRKKHISISEAALAFDVSENTVYKWCRDERLSFFIHPLTGTRRIYLQEIKKHLRDYSTNTVNIADSTKSAKATVGVKEASKALNISVATVRRYLTSGVLRGYQNPINKHRRIYAESIEEIISNRI